mmetsp:Transcript_38273/g.36624  ORF Transcript_38273/g.36624 Transcript_38273/m.36624 type:complete len:126 (+) Transcript_38273:979-1356(+)
MIKEERPGIINSMKTDPIFKSNLINIACTWFSVLFLYYSTQFYTKYMNGDLYFNYLFVQMADLTGCSCYLVFYNLFGLRGSFFFSFIISTTGAVLLTSFFNHVLLIPPLLFIINMGSASALMIIF